MIAPVAFSSAWHVLSMFLVFVIGLFISRYVGLRVASRGWRPLFLYAYHTIWCLVFFWYSNMNGADSFDYYYSGVAGEGEFKFGTSFVVLMVNLLVNVFHLSYLGVFLVFNILKTIPVLIK